jgi:uncharacterized protein (DUF169 family)
MIVTMTKQDLGVLENFDFAIPPVAIKILSRKPEDIERLDKKIALCEMLKEAQKGTPFFVDRDNHTCEAGSYVLGQTDAPGPFISGEFGAGLQVFNEQRAASRIYHYIPRIKSDVANYIAFSTPDKLTFTPDVLILTTRTEQTEIILRAMSYKTGKMWSTRFSPVIGCAWIYVYPYLSGEVNYTITGLGHGMKRRRLFQEGMQIISIPFDQLTNILDSLQEMPWIAPAYKEDGMEFVRKLLVKLGVLTDSNR